MSTHIYDWLEDNQYNKKVNKLWAYLDFRTRPVYYQMEHPMEEPSYKVICTYQGKEYRITGASRLGDIWLNTDFNQKRGYDLRVSIDDCSNYRFIEI